MVDLDDLLINRSLSDMPKRCITCVFSCFPPLFRVSFSCLAGGEGRGAISQLDRARVRINCGVSPAGSVQGGGRRDGRGGEGRGGGNLHTGERSSIYRLSSVLEGSPVTVFHPKITHPGIIFREDYQLS